LQDSLNGFKWTSYWYPVHVLESIDPERPHALQLLGKQLVLWRDGQGKWQCMEDACPHRCAGLNLAMNWGAETSHLAYVIPANIPDFLR